MSKTNRSIAAQVVSGFLKFLAVAVVVLVLIIFVIPLFLSVIKGKDIPPVDDSALQLPTVNLSKEENAFYDLAGISDSIDLKGVPKGKQLVSDYLNSAEWNQKNVKQLLDDNKEALQNFTAAAAKGKFQLPYTDAPSKISNKLPVTPLNSWRELSRLSGIKAIWLAKNGQDKEALAEAFKSVIIGNAIENSQSLLITHLVGIEIKNNGLDILQKVISIIPKNSFVSSEYQTKLKNYQALGNSAPFAIEYLVCKQSVNNLEQGNGANSEAMVKFLMKNKFYFKKNLTVNYCFAFYDKLAVEGNKACPELKKVQEPIIPIEEYNFIKMYFTENLIGKHFTKFYTENEAGYNNVLTQKCATERKLQETLLILNHSK